MHNDNEGVADTVLRSGIMAGAFVFFWLNLAAGPVVGIALFATVLKLLSGE